MVPLHLPLQKLAANPVTRDCMPVSVTVLPLSLKKNTHPKNITALFCEQVLPFVDMTVKGWVWYQGENNMGAPKGNSLVNLGSGKPIGNPLEPSWKGPPSQTPRAGGILAFVRVYHGGCGVRAANPARSSWPPLAWN